MNLAREVVDGRTDLCEDEIIELLKATSTLHHDKDNIVEISGRNVLFVGDLHGDLEALKSVIRIFHESNLSMVFLGDYVDRGPAQVETVNLVFALALAYPGRVTVLRGNHESHDVASKYGFRADVRSKHSSDLFEFYCGTFSTLPLGAISKNGIFACHGGVPRGVDSLEQLQSIDRHFIDFPNVIASQLVWNDPKEAEYTFQKSLRGGRFLWFGVFAFNRFMEDLDLRLFFRAHEVFKEGIKTFFDGRLVSVFSAANHGQVNPKIVRLGDHLRYEPVPLF